MSKRVKVRLRSMRILEKTDHEDRVELDRKIEEKTGKPCDEGVDERARRSQMQDSERGKRKRLMRLSDLANLPKLIK